jgi:hypothetical protein
VCRQLPSELRPPTAQSRQQRVLLGWMCAVLASAVLASAVLASAVLASAVLASAVHTCAVCAVLAATS